MNKNHKIGTKPTFLWRIQKAIKQNATLSQVNPQANWHIDTSSCLATIHLCDPPTNHAASLIAILALLRFNITHGVLF